MVGHSWNDGWEGWDDLYNAQIFIVKWFKRLTGSYLCSKEKWGTIRYERFVTPYWQKDMKYQNSRYREYQKKYGGMVFDKDGNQNNKAWNSFNYEQRPYRFIKIIYERYYLRIIFGILIFIACHRFRKARDEIMDDIYPFKNKLIKNILQFITRTKSYWR